MQLLVRESKLINNRRSETCKKNDIKINNYSFSFSFKFTFSKFKNQNIYIDRALYRRKKSTYSYKSNLSFDIFCFNTVLMNIRMFNLNLASIEKQFFFSTRFIFDVFNVINQLNLRQKRNVFRLQKNQ